MEKVILSTALLLEEGTFQLTNLSLEEAKDWVNENNPTNFVAHSTIKILGLEPASTREVCQNYDEALILKTLGRLEFGKEYSVEEILKIGIQPQLITKID